VTDGEREEGSPQAVSRVDDDYLTVTMLAAGLAGIFGRRARGGGSRSDGLLPEAWRMAFARLWWRCQEQDVSPLDSDLDLLALCTQPFAVWPVLLSLSESDMQNCLIADEELSVFAEQGARVAVADLEAEWTENRVYQALRTAASSNGGGDDKEVEQVYAVLRRRLIDHPVLADLELKQWEREIGATDGSGQTYLQRLVNAAYVPRPASGGQQFLCCPGCRNTVPGQHSLCGTPGCPGGPAEIASVTTLAVIYEQHRATRRFIHDPGLVEARILDALAARKDLVGRVRVTPYPGLDTLDILIEFFVTEGGRDVVAETWGADAKDQDSARLLGWSFTWPESMCCQRRFLVLPEHRMAQPGYAADLNAELDGRVTGVEVVGENRLVSMVAARARGLAR
jgi:REase associating with pPIWI_RE/pPIWI_RE three-gene island domain Y